MEIRSLWNLLMGSYQRNLRLLPKFQGAILVWILFCADVLVHPCDGCASFQFRESTPAAGATPPPPPRQIQPRRRPILTKPPQWYSDPVGSEVRFLVMGDFGGQSEPPFTTYDQLAVAKAAGKVADNFRADFVVELGDNFYEDGVRHVRDKRFKRTFENVYTAPSLQIPWYIVPGNHDWQGNITAQIEYSKVSPRWKFPSLYYRKDFQISPHSRLTLLVIDTMLLCGMGNESLPGSPPTGPWNVTAAEQQWAWLEHQLHLTRSSSYVVVAGHYPVWSVGAHGPTTCLRLRLEPLLYQYNVSAYFAGHDHNLQHIHEASSPVHYFVSGAAAQIDPATTHRRSVPVEWQLFQMGDIMRKGGFAYAEATDEALTVAFTDAKDIWDVYTTRIPPRSTLVVNE